MSFKHAPLTLVGLIPSCLWYLSVTQGGFNKFDCYNILRITNGHFVPERSMSTCFQGRSSSAPQREKKWPGTSVLVTCVFTGHSGSPYTPGSKCTGLKLENYYFFTFTFSRPEVRKLLLFYVFTFSRPEVRKFLLFLDLKLENYSVFTFLLFLDLQDCSNSSELAMGLLRSCTKPSIYFFFFTFSWLFLNLTLENYSIFTFLLFLDLKLENYSVFTFLFFLDLKFENYSIFRWLSVRLQ